MKSMTKPWLLTRLVLIIAIAAFGVIDVSAQAADGGPDQPYPVTSYKAALEKYKLSLSKASLNRRTKGIVTLARTGEAKAFDVLRNRYKRAEQPQDFVRYVVAFNCHRTFGTADYVDIWWEWAKSFEKMHYAQLWYYACGVQVEHGKTERVTTLIMDEKADVYLRVAAIEALADFGEVDPKLQMIIELAGKDGLPRKGMERAMMLEACASLLKGSFANREESKYRDAFESLISHLDEKEKKTPYRTKLVIGRFLKYMYDADQVYINASAWRRVHYGKEAVKGGGHSGTDSVPPPTKFMGVQAAGKRIAYVLDCSGSMLEKVVKPEIKEEPKEDNRRITGGKSSKKEEKERKKTTAEKIKDGDPLDDSDLPWDKIETRWDLAREYLKISLHNLVLTNKKEKDMTFMVAIYESLAFPMKATNGMIEVSERNVQRVIAEIDQIEPIDKSKPQNQSGNRRRGGGTNSAVQRGNTNIHGGMLRAFRAHGRGMMKNELALEHIDPNGWETGCDTVFLLSDGAPNYDDFVATDPWEPGVRVVKDVEKGGTVQPTENIHYQGPFSYSHMPYLVHDIARMNRWRKAEIHCVSIGEADLNTMDQIAAVGLGDHKQVGVGGKR